MSSRIAKKSVLFVFAKSVKEVLSEIDTGIRPESHCYWYHIFKNIYQDIDYVDSNVIHNRNSWIYKIFHRVVFRASDIGFNLELAISSRKIAEGYKKIFCSSDSVALPFLLLKRIGLVNAEIVYQTIGLYDHWKIKENLLFRLLWHWLCGVAATIVCYTPEERIKFISTFKYPDDRLIAIRTIAGFDKKFFDRIESIEGDYVLTVGRDKYRDYGTFCDAMSITGLQGVIVQSEHGDNCLKYPENVKVFYDISFQEVLELYRRARIIVVTVINNYYTAGWTVVGEAMSLGKPTIITKVDSMNGMDDIIKSGENCLVIPSGDPQALADAILKLYGDVSMRRSMGKRAKVVAENYSRKYVDTMMNILK